MNLQTIQSILAAAKNISAAIPGVSALSPLIGVGQGLLSVIDGITAPDDRTQAQMQEARRELAARVSAKAEATADRLDG